MNHKIEKSSHIQNITENKKKELKPSRFYFDLAPIIKCTANLSPWSVKCGACKTAQQNAPVLTATPFVLFNYVLAPLSSTHCPSYSAFCPRYNFSCPSFNVRNKLNKIKIRKWRRFGFWSPSWSFICPGVNSTLFYFPDPKKTVAFMLCFTQWIFTRLSNFMLLLTPTCFCNTKKAKQNQEAHKSNRSWTESLLNTCDRVTHCGYTHSSVDPPPVL